MEKTMMNGVNYISGKWFVLFRDCLDNNLKRMKQLVVSKLILLLENSNFVIEHDKIKNATPSWEQIFISNCIILSCLNFHEFGVKREIKWNVKLVENCIGLIHSKDEELRIFWRWYMFHNYNGLNCEN